MKWRDLDRDYSSELDRKRSQTSYELLGVAENANRREIRSAYLRLVKTYHPDGADEFMSQYNQEVLKLVNAAYEDLRTTDG
jgi:DnaJ-class molecular chaperone